MPVNFKIKPIQLDYSYLFELSEKELAQRNAKRLLVTEKPGFPCRISLEDAEIGEDVILFPYEHHFTSSPYQAKGPVFIRKDVKPADLGVNEIPEMLLHRLLSLRTYDSQGMMIAASTTPGKELRTKIIALLSNPEAQYIQVHNSGPGCYNCQIDRL